MSIRYGNKVSPLASRKSSFFKKDRFDRLRIKQPTPNSELGVWTRPTDWLALPTLLPSEQKIALLMPVYPQGSNFLAFTISGDYTVDWGDGVTENVAAGIKAQHEYFYTDPDLNTTVTSGGYRMAVVVITPQPGQNITSVDFNQKYALTGSTFPDTSPILEIALSCPNLTSLSLGNTIFSLVFCKNLISFFGVNIGLLTSLSALFASLISLENVSLGDTSNVTNMSNMFISCASLTSVPLFNSVNVTNMSGMFSGCSSLTSVPPFNTMNVTNMSSMFISCASLTSVPLFDTTNVTNMSSMFSGCASLTSVPLFNSVNVTNMSGMFNGCRSLTSVPLFDTVNVTSMTSMFNNCTALTSVPLFDTTNVTSMGGPALGNGMFNSCSSLTSVPLFNTTNVTNMSRMFTSCASLTSVPPFNTMNVTNMSSMFSSCSSLTSVPLFDTTNVTNMTSMFNGCPSLTSVPLFDTVNVTSMSNMFIGCASLTSVPLFDTTNVTNMGGMFSGCASLTSVPLFNTVNVTNMTSMFNGCPSLTRAALNSLKYSIFYGDCKLSKEELESIFDYLDTIGVASQIITITNNWGAPTPVTLTGTTTTGSTTISMTNTSGIAIGMQVTGTGSPLASTRNVTFTSDLVNLANHGLSNGDEVSFASLTTTTSIITNKIYYVVNSTIGTFQLAATLNGTPLSLTPNGSGTLRYRTEVVSINPNVSVTVSRPMAASGANSLSFRQLRTGTALLKGWTITG